MLCDGQRKFTRQSHIVDKGSTAILKFPLHQNASYELQEKSLPKILLVYYTRKKITTVLRSPQGTDQAPGSETFLLHHRTILKSYIHWQAGPSVPQHLFESVAGLVPVHLA